MRLAGAITIFLAGGVLVAAPPPKFATAVFSLDAKHCPLEEASDNPLADHLARWASHYRIEPEGRIAPEGPDEPGGGNAALACPTANDASESEEKGASTPKVPATLVLFRDLEETIYLAGCPHVEETSPAISVSRAAEPSAERIKPEEIRDCRDIDAGQTFSAEVEGDVMWAVVRGRQLAFRVFQVQEKPKNISTPYEPSPSRRLPPIGPSTTGERKGLEPQTEPRWEPPQLSAPSAGKPSESRPSDVAPAHTSLRTGRVTIQCPSREFVVVIDGAHIGTCPVTTTLIAGPHTVTVRAPGQAEQVREIQVEAGKSMRLRMKN